MYYSNHYPNYYDCTHFIYLKMDSPASLLSLPAVNKSVVEYCNTSPDKIKTQVCDMIISFIVNTKQDTLL